MARRIWYMAHPLSPNLDEIEAANPAGHRGPVHATQRALDRNIARALRWLAWLRGTFPRVTFIAPWIATIQSVHGDDSPELREAGLVDDCAVVELCHGIVLVGGRISSGMQRESKSARTVINLTCLGDEPPISMASEMLQDLDDGFR